MNAYSIIESDDEHSILFQDNDNDDFQQQHHQDQEQQQEHEYSDSTGSSHVVETEVDPIAPHETDVRLLQKQSALALQRLKRMALFVLILLGVACTTGTWYLLHNREQTLYQQTYNASTSAISDAVQQQVATLHAASRAIADSMSATAVVNKESFPFVTNYFLEPLAQLARTQAKMILATYYAPLVLDEPTRLAYELYTMKNQDWFAIAQPNGTIEPTFPYIFHMEYGSDSSIPFRTRTPPPGPYLPLWQSSPPTTYWINQNLLGLPGITLELMQQVMRTKTSAFTNYVNQSDIVANNNSQAGHDGGNGPYSYLLEPVFNATTNDVAGFVFNVMNWNQLIPTFNTGLNCVLQNANGPSYTYIRQQQQAMRLGDSHDSAYDDTAVTIDLGGAGYSLVLYSSSEFQSSLMTSTPKNATIVVGCFFLFLILAFIAYNNCVTRRTKKVMDAAARSNIILSSLFPANVRSRLFEKEHQKSELVELTTQSPITAVETKEQSQGERLKMPAGKGDRRVSMSMLAASMIPNAVNSAVSSVLQIPKLTLRTFLFDGLDEMETEVDNEELGYKGKPIADLFTDTTIMFSDISGFTAWSSVRAPVQVFTLLESVYRAFDDIAKRRRVFKVETVGDCYVAVAGLPDPMKDHAVTMCRFARDCLSRMRYVTKRLELTLGPDTSELDIRVGIHSGPVTAGVLRGERSRFQLFGDTMHTASRIESTGQRGRIHISHETADLLISSGKSHWIAPRVDRVVAKGKGEIQTFWLSIAREVKEASVAETDNQVSEAFLLEEREFEIIDDNEKKKSDEKTARLIDWNVDVLLRLLRQIVARRLSRQAQADASQVDESQFLETGHLVIDEVKEVITLPRYEAISRHFDPESVVLEDAVVEQLHAFVSNVAGMYHANAFHNFEHASHVTMSVTKLLSRIVAPSDIEYNQSLTKTGKSLHDHTYGITSDPLTQFACVFAALIHDCHHEGVPNAQLVKEGASIAAKYNGKSVAEQNSIDLAWNMLMENRFTNLRRTIYHSDQSFKRFRSLVVNTVSATDIVDKDLKTLRNARWVKAFDEVGSDGEEADADAVNRKATIVIEHLIQASDVSHTMQHWHIYRKWNERFFLECYRAYREGRAESDPSETWYKGEMGFFDFYIIPLARKLKDCGVFGVSSDEYLNYAERNRQEWESKGEQVVQEMLEKANRELAMEQKRRDSLSRMSQRRLSGGSRCTNRRLSSDSETVG